MEEIDPRRNDPPLNEEEQHVSLLLLAALDAPARPLRGDQLDRLVGQAVRSLAPGAPLGVLALLGLGLLLVGGLLLGSRGSLPELMQLALLIPLANLLLGPLAALIIVKRARPGRDA